ncbi:hypothetical protein ABT160_43625 [Streptomyces sp. NPDC001941]|uniref:hypothetical protein n=1 Tax=Streptomyces sp. NPDC001941 TaxID=3154659 RepID=UPI00332AAE2B
MSPIKKPDQPQPQPQPEAALPPAEHGLAVGAAVGATARKSTTQRRRPSFGSYMDRDLQRAFKAACVLSGVEMQDALDQAVRDWLTKQAAS